MRQRSNCAHQKASPVIEELTITVCARWQGGAKDVLQVSCRRRPGYRRSPLGSLQATLPRELGDRLPNDRDRDIESLREVLGCRERIARTEAMILQILHYASCYLARQRRPPHRLTNFRLLPGSHVINLSDKQRICEQLQATRRPIGLCISPSQRNLRGLVPVRGPKGAFGARC